MQQPTRTQELMASISLLTQLIKETKNQEFQERLNSIVMGLIEKLNKELGV